MPIRHMRHAMLIEDVNMLILNIPRSISENIPRLGNTDIAVAFSVYFISFKPIICVC